MPDETGTELTDLDAARRDAVVFAGRLLADLGGRFWDSGDWALSVRDETGRVLFTLTFSAANSAVREPLNGGDAFARQPSPPINPSN